MERQNERKGNLTAPCASPHHDADQPTLTDGFIWLRTGTKGGLLWTW